MNLEINLAITNVAFTEAQTKMDNIKTKLDEVQPGALRYISFDRVGMTDTGEINLIITFTNLTLNQSITTLTAIKNKISAVENASVTEYKYFLT